MVCHIGGQLGTKVVISALGMLALYMCFNGTGIWGGETMSNETNTPYGLTTLNKPKSKEVSTNDGIITQNIFDAAVPTSIETK